MSNARADERSSVEERLRTMLADSSPLPAREIVPSIQLVELGLSSLQLQILAAQIESEFQMTFSDSEVGSLESVGQLIDVIMSHRERA